VLFQCCSTVWRAGGRRTEFFKGGGRFDASFPSFASVLSSERAAGFGWRGEFYEPRACRWLTAKGLVGSRELAPPSAAVVLVEGRVLRARESEFALETANGEVHPRRMGAVLGLVKRLQPAETS